MLSPPILWRRWWNQKRSNPWTHQDKNITHIADRAKYDGAEIGEDLSDRDWFVNPIKDGKPHITDFYKSIYTGALCITVSAPICDESDEIVGVLGLDIRFEELAKLEEEKEF
jgi:hypothetical protein